MTVYPTKLVDVNESQSTEKPKFSCIKIKCDKRNSKVLAAEFLSTAILIFFGCMPYVSNNFSNEDPQISGAISYGLVVLFLVTAFGHISGAYMNPTVTISAVMSGRLSVRMGVKYFIVQLLGTAVGYGLLDLLTSSRRGCFCETYVISYLTWESLFIEMFLSSALIFVYCAVWDPVNIAKQDTVPMKLGFTVTALTLVGRHYTGASMNPARSFIICIWYGSWSENWACIFGPIIGAILTPKLYKALVLEENPTELKEENENVKKY